MIDFNKIMQHQRIIEEEAHKDRKRKEAKINMLSNFAFMDKISSRKSKLIALAWLDNSILHRLLEDDKKYEATLEYLANN